MESQLRVGIDVGCRAHRVGIADPSGAILEEFDISHSEAGFQEFFRRVEGRRQELHLPVAVAMEGYNGYARPLDRLVQKKGYRLFNVNNLKLARFKDVFPGAAKTDPIDARKILELFHLREHLPLAKAALQEVLPASDVNEKLKRISRRRRQLVIEKLRVLNRMQGDLQAVSPELLAATHDADNLWFLRFLSFRDDLRQLAKLRRTTIREIQGVGVKFAQVIEEWQRKATFSDEVEYVGPMIVEDAKRVLDLHRQIAALDEVLAELSAQSEIARRLGTIAGFGKTSIAELAGEIGTLSRFSGEASLALYVGMSPLTVRQGRAHERRHRGRSTLVAGRQ